MRGGWDWVALIYFVCCGVSRLARFNVTAEALSEGGDKVKYFEGTPIPTSVILVGVLALAAGRAGSAMRCGAASGTSARGSCIRSCCCSCCPAR